jgi:hypothetical protein
VSCFHSTAPQPDRSRMIVVPSRLEVACVTDAQTWTLIGGFLAVMVAMSGLLLRVVGAEIRGLRGEMTAQISGLRGEMTFEVGGLRSEMSAEIGGLRGEMNARFDAVNVRFDGVDRRLDGLDNEVQALSRRVFGVDGH